MFLIKKLSVSFLVFLLCLVPAFALSVPKQDSCIYVNDYAGVISESTKKSLVSMNESSDYSTGGYVVVATFDFVEGDLHDYAYKLFNKWGVGDSKNNNGVLLVLDIGNENCAWIIGTGLESTLSDGRCQSIIDDYFKEDFLNKKYDKAVLNTTKQFLKYIENGNFKVKDNQSGIFGIDMENIFIIGIVLFLIVISVIASALSPRRSSGGYRPRRRYHRPPPPPHHGPSRHYGPRPTRRGPGSFGGPTPRSPRPSRRPSQPRSSGGTHHSGGSSRGTGGTLK